MMAQRCIRMSRLLCMQTGPHSNQPSVFAIKAANKCNSSSKSIWCTVRSFASKSHKRKGKNGRPYQGRAMQQYKTAKSQKMLSQTVIPNNSTLFQQFIAKHGKRLAIYVLSITGFIALDLLGAQFHYDDDFFHYGYIFPCALERGKGPSMLPTMRNIEGEFNMYYRDCWSHRLVWFNLDHLKACCNRLLSENSTSDRSSNSAASFRRPWKKGDIVTFYNPYTKYLVTKRIIGVGGDTVQVFGEYAKQFHGDSCGVSDHALFPDPYCKRVFSSQKENATSNKYETTVKVPPNHVWIEGDNPLESTDSRHFGPLPESRLRGRIIMQLWPIRDISFLSSERPDPLASEEWMKDAVV